jgi:hypothetical protein
MADELTFTAPVEEVLETLNEWQARFGRRN